MNSLTLKGILEGIAEISVVFISIVLMFAFTA